MSLACVSIALRWSAEGKRATLRAGLIVAGPLVVFLLAILLGTRDPFYAGIRGVLFPGGDLKTFLEAEALLP